MRSKQEATELSYESFKETFGNVNATHRVPNEMMFQAIRNGTPGSMSPERELPRIGVTGTDGRCHMQNPSYDDLKSNDSDTAERKASFGAGSLTSSNGSNPDFSQETSSSKASPKKGRLRKISMGLLPTFGDVVQAVTIPRRTKNTSMSEGEEEPKTERRSSSILAHIQPYFTRKMTTDNSSTSTDKGGDRVSGISGKRSKRTVSSIPAARLTGCAHKGYLDCRNKKRQWERFWCVLQDACLYCYHTPQSDVTRDTILLRGYDVVADVTNLKRSRFVFRLQQKGVPALHFSSDNHRDFLLWVGTLEKETRSVMTQPTIKSRSFSDEPFSSEDHVNFSSRKEHRSSLPDIFLTPPGSEPSRIKRSASQDFLDHEMVKMQKNKILQEIATSQQQLLEEQKILDRIENPSRISLSMRRMSKEQVLDHYEQEKIQEELRRAKCLTFLNCRRNSAHLKMVQYTKDLSPKTGQLRRKDHAQFSAMEKRLKEIQESLARIDREVAEEEATKQHNFEKLQRKRDLELIVMEQREALNALRQDEAKERRDTGRRHSSFDILSGSAPLHSYDPLASIDELSSPINVQDDSATDASESPSQVSYLQSNYEKETLRIMRTLSRSNSDPCKSNLQSQGEVISEGEEYRQFTDELEANIAAFGVLAPQNVVYLLEKDDADSQRTSFGSDVSFEEVQSEDSTLNLKSTPNICNDIDSSILAKIEDFELFAKLKLEGKKKP